MTRRGMLALTLPAWTASALARPAGSKPFDGKTLTGWAATGKADWSVSDGCIVGRQGPGGAAGDLFTEARWADFEATCEWWMKWPGNSGLWFRYTGPKSAYQADFIDEPAAYPDAHSGSIYCMGKAFIAKNQDASSVRKDGWNRMKLRAEGDRLTVWMNGRQVVEVRDATFAGPGSLGIQVHSGKAFEGMEVRVRKIRVRPLAAGAGQ